MKVAIMMLAHKGLDQLDRLLERLTKDFDVYIHLDEKWKVDINHFEKYNNVYLTERYNINWGSYQQVLADVALFRLAYQKNYDYYMLISGQDLPIKSNNEILAFLEKNKDQSFVDYEAFPKKAWEKDFRGGFTRVEYYYGFDFKKNRVGFILKKFLALVRSVQKLTGLKRKLQPLKYYGGWNWVNISKAGMTHIINYLDLHPSFIKSFKYSLCGDEVWIQTVLMNGQTKVVNNYLRYTDWRGCLENPRMLTMEHLEELKLSDALFARKFDYAADKEVIDKVYEMTEPEKVALV
jgi:hypothetical protein